MELLSMLAAPRGVARQMTQTVGSVWDYAFPIFPLPCRFGPGLLKAW
jgi:hypothetical protein